MKLQLRRPAVADDLDIAPEDFLRVSGAERFHAGFLCREPAGKMDSRHAPACAVRNFAVGKNAPDEPFAVPFDGGGNPGDFGGVETKADYVGHRRPSTA